MKLILSRKGFDSGENSGGCASPIFHDGAMFSLPIPDSGRPRLTYGDLRHPQADIGELAQNLTRGRINANHPVHMSPDLNPPDGCPRLFDQVKAAVGHLNNQGVKEGDLFLFFGLYRRVARTNDGWRYTQAPEQHVLWGWLQVGEKHRPQEGEDKLRCMCCNNNTRYVASAQLDLCGGLKGTGVKGAGVFPCFDDRLLLTEPGQSKSHWKLPRWFYPAGRKSALTYHDPKRTKFNRWTTKKDDPKHVYLQSVGRGQEFVLDCDYYPEAKRWACDLIREFGDASRK